MPPGRERFSTSLLGQSAFLRGLAVALVAILLWLAIHWAVLLP